MRPRDPRPPRHMKSILAANPHGVHVPIPEMTSRRNASNTRRRDSPVSVVSLRHAGTARQRSCGTTVSP
ncbi:hypothetical protein LSM04_006807 [Trypanosoma melophagium]|uniref:uncharacterized protein n=1 Tax=Trypanosoma melophagium TaxID=715481 RepID=UPI00351A4E5A|nr:hypothetical protein LSM04_006807 [Trypanosoma melophagium]